MKSKNRSRSRGKKNDIIISNFDIHTFSDIPKRIKYEGEIKKTSSLISKHAGQRKLFYTELYFLSLYAKLSSIILYIGSAPGLHLPLLSYLFPDHIFYLYDPREFGIKPSSKFIIRQKLFTDDDAKEFKGKNILFISDIRGETDEESIIWDMNKQKEWIEEMRPVRSMLKFRLPFGDDKYCLQNMLNRECKYEYLKGTLLLQPWAPLISTEMRLIVDNSLQMKVYDCIEIEEKCYYHNKITRNTPIKINTKTGTKQISWDIFQEYSIINLFKKNYPKFKNVNITELTNKYSYKPYTKKL